MKTNLAATILFVVFSLPIFAQDYPVYSSDTENDSTELKEDEKKIEPESRNIMAIGYQIGGYSLIGVDYEVRFHDYAGLHFGAGFLGFTGGVKIHTNPHRDSPFFNLSFKDAGLGQMRTAGLEYGSRILFNRSSGKSLGLYTQAGLAYVIYIDSGFERTLYGGEAPEISFVMGIGLSW